MKLYRSISDEILSINDCRDLLVDIDICDYHELNDISNLLLIVLICGAIVLQVYNEFRYRISYFCIFDI